MIVSYDVRMSLQGRSLVGEFINYAHYQAPEAKASVFLDAYVRMIRAARAGDLGDLYRDRLKAARGGEIFELEVDVSNGQFIGAQLTTAPFALGYEPEILALLAKYLPRDGVFYDAGSNWGYFSLHVLLDPQFTGRVVAFEPVRRSAHDLRRLSHALGYDARLDLRNVAVGDRAMTTPISDDAWSGNQSLAGDDRRGELVEVVRIDDLDLSAPNVIKLDVENFETEALLGARRKIESSRPVLVVENWWKEGLFDSSARCLSLLRDMGYTTYIPQFRPIEVGGQAIPFRVTGDMKLTRFAAEERKNFAERVNVVALPREMQSAP